MVYSIDFNYHLFYNLLHSVLPILQSLVYYSIITTAVVGVIVLFMSGPAKKAVKTIVDGAIKVVGVAAGLATIDQGVRARIQSKSNTVDNKPADNKPADNTTTESK